MRSETPRYPVDRYMVESSKKIEMVNIIDDEIWNSEPGLRPEDEIILRKLHKMLQSTADDLKLLSGELSKFREPGVQVKTLPTPLDEEFNEKVHIEEVVNAKFHGYKILDRSSSISAFKEQKDNIQSVANNLRNTKVNNIDVEVNEKPLKKRTVFKNFGISRTKVIQINGSNHKESIKDNKQETKEVISTPTVTYNEFSYKYPEPNVGMLPNKVLQIQHMPSINIRSQLKEQKVLHLDILPDNDLQNGTDCKINVGVIAVQHETVPPNIHTPHKEQTHAHSTQIKKQPIRKTFKMSTCESSESVNNRSTASSDTQRRLKTQKQIRKVIRTSPKTTARNEFNKSKKVSVTKKETDKRTTFNLDEWKRKLNSVYGQSPSLRKNKVATKGNAKIASKKTTSSPRKSIKQQDDVLNNADYIPYSHLTLGGVRVSDIEKELSNISNKNDIPLSPILDKILSSRENSFHTNSPKKRQKNKRPKILTTSDENLLKEVINIEKTVSKTLTNNLKNKLNETYPKAQNDSSENNSENGSYADDFEDEKSDRSIYSEKQSIESQSDDSKTDPQSTNFSHDKDVQGSSHDEEYESQSKKSITSVHDTAYAKATNLSFKNTVDVFEYVHSVDTQDTATQSHSTSKISLKETQTSPRNDKPNIQPIHNDLWPSIDLKGDVERMFKLEKDFIKKILIEEYGDLLERNIAKPSTSKDSNGFEEKSKNIVAFQKNTQTSPGHVKSVMTSPTRVKTRTTSPFAMSFTVDHETSPLIFVTNEESKVETETETEDLGISVNLSSPRFSLRLPQTSREILTNLELNIHTPAQNIKKNIDHKQMNQQTQTKTFRRNSASSSSSIDGDISSSDISSLGELKFIRRLGRYRNPTVSESSSTSTFSKNSLDVLSGNSGILPLRSEGEISLKENFKRKPKISKSEGEMSFAH